MDPEKQLERFIDEQLRKLPDQEAPEDLASSVLAVIAAKAELPWYKQPFTRWPRPTQNTLFVLLGLLISSVIYLVWNPAEKVTLTALLTQAQQFSWLADIARTLAESAQLVLKSFTWPVFAAIGGVFAILYSACLAAGIALWRVANPRTPHA